MAKTPWYERLRIAYGIVLTQWKKRGESPIGWCDAIAEQAAIIAEIEYPRIQGTALTTGRELKNHPKRYPRWRRVSKKNFARPGGRVVFLVRGGRTQDGEDAGHVGLLINPIGGGQRYMYDNNGRRKWTPGMAARLWRAYEYIE